MMRSLYSGVSGLLNHQVRMDTLGHNVANVNTTGFKKGRVNFQSQISQSMSSASAPRDNRGGINPRQVGLGMLTASIDTLHQQGSFQTTSTRTDLAIDGNGYFVVGEGNDASMQKLYTRAGTFSVDSAGFLVNPGSGMHVLGWNREQMGDGSTRIAESGPLQKAMIPIGEKLPARATENVFVRSNLNAEAAPVANVDNISDSDRLSSSFHRTSIEVFDDQGTAHTLELSFIKVDSNRWRIQAHVPTDPDNPQVVEGSVSFDVGSPYTNPEQSFGYVYFDDAGVPISLQNGGGLQPFMQNTENLSFNVSFVTQNGQEGGRQHSVSVNLGSVGETRGITQYAGEGTTRAHHQDGFTMGYLVDFSIDAAGLVRGIYSNDQQQDLAKIAVASFANEGGLENQGGTLFQESSNSGRANIGSAETENRGQISSGNLEMSNVNLAEEFTNMIVTERGFQANSRAITASDRMLQELLTLKR